MPLNILRHVNKRLKIRRNSRLIPSLFLCGTWMIFLFHGAEIKPSHSSASETDFLVRSWHLKDPHHGDVPFFNKEKWRDLSGIELVLSRSGIYAIGGSRLGDDGKPVSISDQSLKKLAAKKKSTYQLNVVVSELIPLNRTLPEVRNIRCLSKSYPSLLPTISIIIVFHNEASSTILRTAVSAIDRSPKGVVKEIIFVDDASTNEDLGSKFQDRISNLNVKCKIIRQKNREGLITARIRGAEAAAASVLFFMDAHMELSPGWAEPLLAEILKDRTKIVAPVIDDIDDEDFSYKRVEVDQMRGGFNWKLRHAWIEPLKYENLDSSDPFPTPTIIGGVFAIDKEFFFASGSFDPGMKIWGGENIEISLRIWRCGGSLLIVPCSRVGHIYRKKSPHSVPGGFRGQLETEGINIGRCAHVWLDEYVDFYSYMNTKELKLGDLKKRLLLKRGCHDMNWYLSHIYPDSPLPTKYKYVGQIKLEASGQCLDGIGLNGEEVGLRLCHGLGSYQIFILKDSGQIQCDVHCLMPSDKDTKRLIKGPCSFQNQNQKWSVKKNGQIIHSLTGKCLTFESTSINIVKTSPKSILNYLADLTKESLMETVIPGPILSECDFNIDSQIWKMDSPLSWRRK
uniref:Polypeptide N-acetylgalactosaminyltransferase n=2 Tax=Lepeophtheirus salmonis TaxID=72036 RepID=A0A0K2UC80_LEPSM